MRSSDPISAERRQLTVVSCSLAEAAALASRLDPEDLCDLIDTYQRAIAEIVTRLEGFVAKHSGDGALIYFGYPDAREDDAERAIRCALTVADMVTRSDPTKSSRPGSVLRPAWAWWAIRPTLAVHGKAAR